MKRNWDNECKGKVLEEGFGSKSHDCTSNIVLDFSFLDSSDIRSSVSWVIEGGAEIEVFLFDIVGAAAFVMNSWKSFFFLFFWEITKQENVSWLLKKF